MNDLNRYAIFEQNNHLKPSIEKKSFDELHLWDFGWAILETINIAPDQGDGELALSKRFSPGQKSLYFFWYLDAEVVNGGFIQFYLNDNRKYLQAILAGLRLVGDNSLINLIEKADQLYLINQNRFASISKQVEVSLLYKDLKEFEPYDEEYYKLHDITMDLIEQYIRKHPDSFLTLT